MIGLDVSGSGFGCLRRTAAARHMAANWMRFVEEQIQSALVAWLARLGLLFNSVETDNQRRQSWLIFFCLRSGLKLGLQIQGQGEARWSCCGDFLGRPSPLAIDHILQTPVTDKHSAAPNQFHLKTIISNFQYRPQARDSY